MGLLPNFLVFMLIFPDNVAQSWTPARALTTCLSISHPLILIPRLCHCLSDARWASASNTIGPSGKTITAPLTNASIVWEAVIIISSPLGCGPQPRLTLHYPQQTLLLGTLEQANKIWPTYWIYSSLVHFHLPFLLCLLAHSWSTEREDWNGIREKQIFK